MLRVRLAGVVATYALGIVLAATLAVGGTWRLASILIGEPPSRPVVIRAPTLPPVLRLADGAPLSRIPPATSQSLRREAGMLPLQDRWFGMQRYRGSPFGSSSRSPANRERNWWEDDEDVRPRSGGTYRTVCVRLCDGYYFPINFAVTSDRLARDAQVCESRCGNQGRLFVQTDQTNPRGSADDMVDLTGRSYRDLRTAFLYRTEYVPSCKCQAQPWEEASQDRHRAYALAAAARKGSKEAAKELQALQAKARLAPPPAANAETPPQMAQNRTLPDERALMRLGTDPPPAPVARPAPQPERSTDWQKRAFSPNN